VLAVRGQRSPASQRQPSSYHVMEISHGLFERVVPLPVSVDPDRTSANVRNGMLEVCMPKAKPQRISINVSVNATEPGDGR
jgi:HSP20 family protein